jgi:hypothetical protein
LPEVWVTKSPEMNYYNYFTEIEEHFVRRRGKHLMVSPMDWGLIAVWRDSGIPLHVALRGIDLAMDTFQAKSTRGSSRVSTLFYCHDSVMAEYARYVEAHVGEKVDAPADASDNAPASSPAAGEGLEKAEVQQFIEDRIKEVKALLERQSSGDRGFDGIDRVLARLGEIKGDIEKARQFDLEAIEHDLSILDQILVDELETLVPPERLAEWDQESKKELRIYKKRLPKETFDKIHQNYLRVKLHHQFNIGELSLFHL